jgi:hypothetical protein
VVALEESAETADAAEAGADDKQRGRLWTFCVDKGMPLLTAILTVLAAALGVWGVKATSDKDKLADTVDALEEKRDVVAEDNKALVADLADMTTSRDHWKDRAETADAADELTGPGTDTGTTGVGTTPGDLTAEPAGVFRQTGGAPVTFARSYGIDLDSRDKNWGIGTSGGDVQLNGTTTGLYLWIPSHTIALVDEDATYEDCNAQTVLQPNLSAEQTVVGRRLCVKTMDGRWAFVKILGLDTERETVTLHVVVWTLATD